MISSLIELKCRLWNIKDVLSSPAEDTCVVLCDPNRKGVFLGVFFNMNPEKWS